MKCRSDNTARIAIAVLVLALPLFAQPAEQNGQSRDAERSELRYKASQDPADAAACSERLHKIHDAIMTFQTANKRLPRWLSELTDVPMYLDAKLLVCPYVEKIADLSVWRRSIRSDVFMDPKESTSYAYEFIDRPMSLWTGLNKTWADYKRRQMNLLGEGVPIVRCFAHEPVLNLSYSGRIFSSGTDWEKQYAPRFKHEDLHPEPLFFHQPPRADVNRIPARAADTDPRMLDLTKHYNAYLDETWLPFPRDCDLKRLLKGSREFRGVPFDVRGLIQLNGAHLLAPYPVVVTGLRVGRPCTKLHFLHATRPGPPSPDRPATKVNDGTKVSSYIVHYRSGAQVEIPIVYGQDVKDWWFDLVFPDHEPTKVVWEGENVASLADHRRIRLFLTSWQNPWKEQLVESLSLVSAMAETAPFVIAITLE